MDKQSAPSSAFTDEQLERYARHIILSGVGLAGQKKLAAGSVLVVGAGGLGSPAALYLAAAGVGRIGVVDADTVSLSNLQRQIIHSTADLGRLKVDSARESMVALNPDVHVETYPVFLDAGNVMDIISSYDYVLDCSDNAETKFLINDACVLADEPFTIAGIMRFYGQILSVTPHKTPCYRCVFGEPPVPGSVPTCAEAGVIGALAGMMGAMEALEAVKYLCDVGGRLTGRLLTIDTLTWDFHEVQLSMDPSCDVCGNAPTITQPIDFERTACDFTL